MQYRFFLLFTFLLISSCKTPSSFQHPPASSPASLDDKSLSAALQAIQGQFASAEVETGTVGVLNLTVPPNVRLSGEFEGIELSFYEVKPGSVQALIPVQYLRAAGPAEVKVTVESGKETQKAVFRFHVKDGNYSSEILHVDGRRVNPTKKADLARIVREIKEIAVIYKARGQKKYWSGPFQLPIVSEVTSAFGTKRLYNGQLKNFHTGLDLRAPIGTPIYSAAPGVIVLSKNLFYTGNTVLIDHGHGIITLYAHMSELRVKTDSIVGSHELLGLSGKTGRVNGPHLHWQAVVDGIKINPIGLTQATIQ